MPMIMLYHFPLDHGGGGRDTPLFRFIDGEYQPVYSRIFGMDIYDIDSDATYSPTILPGSAYFFTCRAGRTVMLAYDSAYGGLSSQVVPFGYYYLDFDKNILALESIHTHSLSYSRDHEAGHRTTRLYRICVSSGERTPADFDAWWDEWVAHHYYEWDMSQFLANPTIIGMPHEPLTLIPRLTELEIYIVAAMREMLGLS